MKFFKIKSFSIIGFFAMLCFFGCGGEGDKNLNDIPIVDNGSYEDAGVNLNDANGEDDADEDEKTANVDTIDYPEPGTVEYWIQIIPGTWEEDPCVETSSDSCIIELQVRPVISESVKTICPDSEYYIISDEGLGYISGLCLENDSVLSLCKGTNECTTQAEGKLIEKVISEGICANKTDSGESRTCARMYDCADLGGSECNGAKVEYWMEFCFYEKGDDCSPKTGNQRSLVKID